MSKMLIMLLTGKDNINTEMVSFSFAFNAVRHARATVEFLFLGRGVRAANENQKGSPRFFEQIVLLEKKGIPVKIWKASMAGERLSEKDIFPRIEMVPGGVEIKTKIEDGYSILTF
ncbi:MAG: DsrE family protein [Thermoplasmataceae archaeon]